jgi:RimJ/RimL family protein N-acetyltransferase
MKLEGFPKKVSLRDGTEVVIRPMSSEDAAVVLEFFRALPEEDRQYLRDDVTKPEWAERFVHSIDHDSMIPLVAEHAGALVGTATLYRTKHGWTKHVAQIRVSVARTFQRKGLGTSLARVLVRMAIGFGLEKMVAQVVENQVAAIKAFERLGFKKEAVLQGHVKDTYGIKRDLVVMSNDVSHLWEQMEAMVSDFQPAIE